MRVLAKCLIWAFRLGYGLVILSELVFISPFVPTRENWGTQGEELRCRYAEVLREKAPRNPEAAAALDFIERHPRLQIWPVSWKFLRKGGRLDSPAVRAHYDERDSVIFIVTTTSCPLVDKRGCLLPWTTLKPQLEATAPIIVHEVAHARAAADLGFSPSRLFENELYAMDSQRRYIRRDLVLTPRLARIGHAKAYTTRLGQNKVLAGSAVYFQDLDPERKSPRWRTFDEWTLWSKAEMELGDEIVDSALLFVLPPRDLCEAMRRPDWYGGFTTGSGAPSSAHLKWARDPRRLAAARDYFRARLTEYSGCLRWRVQPLRHRRARDAPRHWPQPQKCPRGQKEEPRFRGARGRPTFTAAFRRSAHLPVALV